MRLDFGICRDLISNLTKRGAELIKMSSSLLWKAGVTVAALASFQYQIARNQRQQQINSSVDVESYPNDIKTETEAPLRVMFWVTHLRGKPIKSCLFVDIHLVKHAYIMHIYIYI